MIPLVTVPSRPNGLPIATTPSPTWTALESASGSGVSFEAGAEIFSTARSLEVSLPTTVAFHVLPSESFTETELAPSITCSFVTMWPSPS